jgi:hypothetical protein
MSIKISELPSGTAGQNDVVPVANAAGTQTSKVTLMGIASLATKHTVGLGKITANNIVSFSGLDNSEVKFGGGGEILYKESVVDGGVF